MRLKPVDFARAWAREIEAAQRRPTRVIAGREYRRIPYGAEADLPPANLLKPVCWDCGTRVGMFHVEPCCVERCPACLGQARACDCGDDPAAPALH